MSADYSWISGMLLGVLSVIFLLSLLISATYREPSLAVLAGAALLGILSLQLSKALAFHELGLVFSHVILIMAAGRRGALRRPSLVLAAVSAWGVLLAFYDAFLAMPGLWYDLIIQIYGLCWLMASVWSINRMWRRSLPWFVWMVAGLVFMFAGFVLFPWVQSVLVSLTGWTKPQAHTIWMSLHICLYCFATYISLVWRSRLLSESTLRAGSYEMVDPLTGCMTPKAFALAVQQSAERSTLLAYEAAVLMVSNTNHGAFSKSVSPNNPELGVLMTSELVRRTARSQDAICRMSHSTFAVLIDGMNSPEYLKEVSSKIVAASLRLQRPHAGAESMKMRILGARLPAGSQDITAWLTQLQTKWVEHLQDANAKPFLLLKTLFDSK